MNVRPPSQKHCMHQYRTQHGEYRTHGDAKSKTSLGGISIRVDVSRKSKPIGTKKVYSIYHLAVKWRYEHAKSSNQRN